MNLRLKKQIEDKRCQICGNIKPGHDQIVNVILNDDHWKLNVNTGRTCPCGHYTEHFTMISYNYLIRLLVGMICDFDKRSRGYGLISSIYHEYVVIGIVSKKCYNEDEMFDMLKKPWMIFVEDLVPDDGTTVRLREYEMDRLQTAVMIAKEDPSWTCLPA